MLIDQTSLIYSASVQSAPPGFLRLAGHPLRWRLLSELARSDRPVRELTALLGQPQSLVSYHLARLRAGGLVTARRSSADGRDAYYSIDLARCGELLTAAGAALHPGLRLRPPAAGPVRVRARVLFLCTGNSARSQMAEAILEQMAGDAVTAVSAGSHPKPLHPNAVRVIREHGIDISRRQSRHLSDFDGKRFDYVITLCDRVREICPEFPAPAEMIHWSIADPAADPDGPPAFERTADVLTQRRLPAARPRRPTAEDIMSDVITGPGGRQIVLDDPAGPRQALRARPWLTCLHPAPRRSRDRPEGVGADRLHRVRRPARAHRAAAQLCVDDQAVAGRAGVRGRHRRLQPAARPGLHPAGDLLRLAGPRPGGRAGRWRRVHPARADRDPRSSVLFLGTLRCG